MSGQECVAAIPAVMQAIGITEIPMTPVGVDYFLPLVNRVVSDGSVVVIKMDGERIADDDGGRYTVIISGGNLGRDYYRSDSDSLEEALAKPILEYAQRQWDVGDIINSGCA
jgi:hypothetical protein